MNVASCWKPTKNVVDYLHPNEPVGPIEGETYKILSPQRTTTERSQIGALPQIRGHKPHRTRPSPAAPTYHQSRQRLSRPTFSYDLHKQKIHFTGIVLRTD